MKSLVLPGLAAALALAACQPPQITDNAAVNAEGAADLDGAAFNDAAPVVEDADAGGTQAVAVAAVPKPIATLPATEAAPLNDAAAIEKDIRAGTGIQRIRYGEGWAWTRGGKILRTADRDGRNVAYFRGDDDKPFFVQRGDESWAYQGGKPVRVFDRDGRARTPDAGKAREAVEAERAAREQRQRAEQARDRAGPAHGNDRPGQNGSNDRGNRDSRDARPSPTPTPSARPHGRDPGDRPDAGGSGSTHHGTRDRHEHRDN